MLWHRTTALSGHISGGGFTHDANGNLTAVNAAGVLTTMAYNSENQLVSHEDASSKNWSLLDADGYRVHYGDEIAVTESILYMDRPNAAGEWESGFGTHLHLCSPTTPPLHLATPRRRSEATRVVPRGGVAGFDQYFTLTISVSSNLVVPGIERLEAQRMASPQSNDPLKTTKRSYPLYDGHGNMIATLGRTATGYTVANEKKYDVWGAVRASQSPGSHVVNPNKRYCANLGHTFDGESDLIYMRARYYEPATGRFISEDPANDHWNWYAYGANNPVVTSDFTGMWISKSKHNWAWGQAVGYMSAIAGLIVGTLTTGVNGKKTDPVKRLTTASSLLAVSVASFAFALSFGTDAPIGVQVAAWAMSAVGALARFAASFASLIEASDKTKYSLASVAVIVTSINVLMVMGALIAIDPVD